jgi:hypothetical protein
VILRGRLGRAGPGPERAADLAADAPEPDHVRLELRLPFERPVPPLGQEAHLEQRFVLDRAERPRAERHALGNVHDIDAPLRPPLHGAPPGPPVGVGRLFHPVEADILPQATRKAGVPVVVIPFRRGGRSAEKRTYEEYSNSCHQVFSQK